MNKPLVCAELSANHLGSLGRALEIVDSAAWAGADLFKVQTWSPGRMVIDRTYRLPHGPWAGRLLFDLYAQAFLPWEWHRPIFDRARQLGMVPFSAAFDWEAVDFLETLGVDRHKVASFELTDLPLIRYMAGKGKPMILSTGMGSRLEIAQAHHAAVCGGRNRVTLLRCVSAYPAEAESYNLRMLQAFNQRWLTEAGVSDHTIGHDCAVVATALGATMIEKHLTLSRADGGPDAGFSAEPQEFRDMVQAVRRAALALGEVRYGPGPGEDVTLRRSLWVLRDIEAGEALRFGDNVVTARPALGLPPSTILSGRRAACALKAGRPLLQEHIA